MINRQLTNEYFQIFFFLNIFAGRRLKESKYGE